MNSPELFSSHWPNSNEFLKGNLCSRPKCSILWVKLAKSRGTISNISQSQSTENNIVNNFKTNAEIALRNRTTKI